MNRSFTTRAALAAVMLVGSLWAQAPKPAPIGAEPTIPKDIGPQDVPTLGLAVQHAPKPVGSSSPAQSAQQDNVMFDHDGSTLWAAGRNYKLGFDQGGATFIPALGDVAPANTPVTFGLAGIEVDGHLLPLDGRATPVQHGSRVSFARGDVQEVYDPALAGAEQSFVMPRPFGAGAHVLHIATRTSLTPTTDDRGIVFQGQYGQVVYSTATAIDAAGRTRALTLTLGEDEIRITVPADYLEKATWPVTVDPLIQTMTISAGPDDCFAADAAFEAVTGHFLVVCERAYSATDHDIFSWQCYASGLVILGSYTSIDTSATNWTHPRVAAKTYGTQFLVVGQRGTGTSHQIWGRTVEAEYPPVSGSQFAISTGDSGDLLAPVVGGDPNLVPPTYYCVAWQRMYSSTDDDIHACLVTDQSTIHGSLIAVDDSPATHDQLPSISKSDGDGDALTQAWTIAWQRAYPGEHDILAARINWNGVNVTAPYGVNTTGLDTSAPSVASITDGALGARRYLVAYEVHGYPTTRIGFSIMQGNTFLAGSNNLAQVEGRVSYPDRIHPAATCTGATFSIAYAEQWAGPDYDVHATTLNLIGGSSFSVSEASLGLLVTAAREDFPSLASKYDGGDLGVNVLTVCEVGTAPRAIEAALFDARAPYGGLSSVATGCDGLGISFAGQPVIGQPVSVSLLGSGVFSLIVISAPINPIPICGSCALGVDIVNSPILIYSPNLSGLVPGDGIYVGVTFGIQGAGSATNACGYRVTDTLLVTIM